MTRSIRGSNQSFLAYFAGGEVEFNLGAPLGRPPSGGDGELTFSSTIRFQHIWHRSQILIALLLHELVNPILGQRW